MAKEIVQFKNDMNKLKFAGLGKSDMNLFMAVCSKVKEQGDNIVHISFDYLRQISHYTGHTVDGFISDLKRMSQRIMAVNCEIIMDNGGFDIFNLFQRFIADPETQILTVKVNPDFTWLLNEFTDKIKGYTTFELQEFVGLQSKYAKTLYRLLKQWRSTGQYIFNDIDDFREKMDVPKAYSNMRLMTKIIEPAVKELKKLDKSFINFKCEPLYAKKRGKPLVGYKFTWQVEQLPRIASINTEPIIAEQSSKPKRNYSQNKPNNQFQQFMQREITPEELEEFEQKLLEY